MSRHHATGVPPIATTSSLATELGELGVDRGDTLIVHCALSAFVPVVGGAGAVVLALRHAVADTGTVVMPAQSWQLCDPAYLADPAVPQDMWDTIRATMPPYDPSWTPSQTMGAVAEALRTHPAALRSGHPHRSFAAWGRHAAEVVARHDLDDPVGEGSPLAALYGLDARVLLLGVGHDKNTSLHLAEARSGRTVSRVANGAPMLVDGVRQWITFTEPVTDDSDFNHIGAAFQDQTGLVRQGRVGGAVATLMPQPDLVDFAAQWMRTYR